MWSPKFEKTVTKPAAILRALREAIEKGELQPGERIPPHRELAFRLGVNLSTITRAMNEAAREGLIGGEVGRGTFVMPTSDSARLFAQGVARQSTLDLSTIGPPAIDQRAISEVMQAVLDEEPDLFSYPHARQLLHARMAVVQWLRWRGYEAGAPQVALTAGAQAALHSVVGMLLASGDTLLVEDFTFPGIKAIAKLLGLRLHGVACDAEGLVPAALDQACRITKAKAVFAIPNLQNPTGSIMPRTRRQEIVSVIERRGLVLVEDDVYGSYSGQPPLAAGLSTPHVLVGSLSKAVAPSLRFGFVAGTHPVLDRLQDEVSLTSWLCPPINLATASRLIFDTTAMRLAEQQAAIIKERCRALQQIFPVLATPATHLWLPIGSGDDFVERAGRHGISVAPGHFFATGANQPEHVRISLSGPEGLTELKSALTTLAALR